MYVIFLHFTFTFKTHSLSGLHHRIVTISNFVVCLLLSQIHLVDRARASFKTKFGSMGLRDRGLRLAGYLTPPSDLAQEDDDNAERYQSIHILNIGGIHFNFFFSIFVAVEWCRHWKKSNRVKYGRRLHLSPQRRPL